MWLMVTDSKTEEVKVFNLEQVVYFELKEGFVHLRMSSQDQVKVENLKVPKQFGRKEQTLWDWLLDNTVNK